MINNAGIWSVAISEGYIRKRDEPMFAHNKRYRPGTPERAELLPPLLAG